MDSRNGARHVIVAMEHCTARVDGDAKTSKQCVPAADRQGQQDVTELAVFRVEAAWCSNKIKRDGRAGARLR